MTNHTVSPFKTGVALGGLLGLWHLGWSTLVATGMAQPVLDAVFQLHMIKSGYIVQPFYAEYAIGLVLVTSGFGFVLGYLFGMIWNASKKA